MQGKKLPATDAGLCWRRLTAMLLVAVTSLTFVLAAPADESWERYKSRFMSADGRILDSGNGDVSHSEGQGFGMLLAEAQGDREAFDRLWQWTRLHLARTDVALFSWRYDPTNVPPVADPNNASDGDILIAWALQRAASRWQEPRYAQAAAMIREAIAEYLVVQRGGYRVLLPGVQGFRGEGYVDLNLSYWVMPALLDFAQAEPDAGWETLVEDGLRLLEQGRFGRYRLPTDWLRLDADGSLAPAPGWPPRFGFDAVRIPLYLAWADQLDRPGVSPILALWNDPARQPPPAWIDVYSEARAEYAASRGVLAIRALAGRDLRAMPAGLAPGDDYYSASLLLLARLAQRESAPAPD